jgi:SRSO17 transposase
VVGKSLEDRFEEYGEVIGAALAHADRRMPAQWYLRGLMLPGGRKSVEPMAARVQPQNVRSAHQSMHHLVADAEWSDQALLAAVTAQVLPALVKKDAACHWIIDDTGYGKKGTHSVGVARQYCGRLGKTDNCQVAVSLSIANEHGSLPVTYQLYMPQDWASDPARRKRAGVPAQIEFRTKGDMALEQIHQALNAGLPRGVVLADAAYGTEAAWRDQLTRWGLPYAVAVREHTRVWYGKHRPLSEAKPVHYWLCTLPANTPMKKIVATAMGRWRIERDYQELKSELGLHHYEGRNWRGFHHHASLCIAAYGFLMRERLRSKKNSAQLKAPALPKGFRPRGARSDATTRSKLDRHNRLQSRPSDRKRSAHVPLLRPNREPTEARLLTQ